MCIIKVGNYYLKATDSTLNGIRLFEDSNRDGASRFINHVAVNMFNELSRVPAILMQGIEVIHV